MGVPRMREVAPAGTRLKRGGGGTKPRSGDQVYDRLYAGPTAPISTWKQVPGTKPCWEAFFRNLRHAKTMWRFVPERADICDLCKVLTDRMYWKTAALRRARRCGLARRRTTLNKLSTTS